MFSGLLQILNLTSHHRTCEGLFYARTADTKCFCLRGDHLWKLEEPSIIANILECGNRHYSNFLSLCCQHGSILERLATKFSACLRMSTPRRDPKKNSSVLICTFIPWIIALAPVSWVTCMASSLVISKASWLAMMQWMDLARTVKIVRERTLMPVSSLQARILWTAWRCHLCMGSIWSIWLFLVSSQGHRSSPVVGFPDKGRPA